MKIGRAIAEQLEFRRVKADIRHFIRLNDLSLDHDAIHTLARTICDHGRLKAIVAIMTGTDHGYRIEQPSVWATAKALFEDGEEKSFTARRYINVDQLDKVMA